MTKTRARRAVANWAEGRLRRRITLIALDQRWNGSLKDFGANVAIDDAVEKAFAVGRTGNILRRALCLLPFAGAGKRIIARIALEPRKLDGVLRKVARSIDRPHRDAALRVVANRLQVVPDGCGIKVNRDKAGPLLRRSLISGLSVIPLPVEVDKPDITTDDAAGINTELSTFTTPFNPGKRDRTHNLTLAARALSGAIVKPGQVFSYNSHVGPRLMSRGFRNAPIFVKGKLEPGIGGGVCQVSSTLYNAALLAGLKVVERSHHCQVVPYVSPGRDATVAYGLLDLKFENSNGAPIALISQVGRSRLAFSIYGSAPDKKTVRVFTSKPMRTAAGSKMVTDASLAAGARKVVEKGVRGASVTVYREITGPDGTKITEVVSRDRYPAQHAIVAVGPAAVSARKPENPPDNVRAVAGE